MAPSFQADDRFKASSYVEEPGQLTFLEFNTEGDRPTILMLHGSPSHPADCEFVTPYLDAYHLLMPSFFTPHSLASTRNNTSKGAFTSFSSLRDSNSHDSLPARLLELCVELLKTKAHGGKAHIAGGSFGSVLTLALASSHPEFVQSVFVTGYQRHIVSSWQRPIAGSFLWSTQLLTNAVPQAWANNFMEGLVDFKARGDGGREGKKLDVTTREVADGTVVAMTGGLPIGEIEVGEAGKGWDGEKLRVRCVAATYRTRWMPTGDTVEDAVSIARTIAGSCDCADVQVYEAAKMLHPWNRQEPELFARCMISTIEGTTFPGEQDGMQLAHPA